MPVLKYNNSIFYNFNFLKLINHIPYSIILDNKYDYDEILIR